MIITCPACTARYQLQAHLADRRPVQCPRCQNLIPTTRQALGPPKGTEGGSDPFDQTVRADSIRWALPQGIRILEARIIPRKAPSLSGSISRYVYAVEVPGSCSRNLADRVKKFVERASVIVERKGKQKDIKPAIESVSPVPSTDGAVLEVTLQDREEARARIQDVIEKLFEIGPEESALFRIKRTAVSCSVEGRWESPMDVK